MTILEGKSGGGSVVFEVIKLNTKRLAHCRCTVAVRFGIGGFPVVTATVQREFFSFWD